MHILYICRLFTGFEKSLQTTEWTPLGAPTIAKMINHLDQHDIHSTTFVWTCKDYNSSWKASKDQIVKLHGLNTKIHILAGKNRFPQSWGRIREKLREIVHLLKIWKLYKKTKPDLIYCDRVNLPIAAFFATFTKTPVIWRIMGVLQEMHSNLTNTSPRAKLFRKLYKSQFAAVICTLDGSNGQNWMNNALNAKTKKHLLVNGYTPETTKETCKWPQNKKCKILFPGRIEQLKGLTTLLNTAKTLKKQEIENLQFIIAGYGTAEEWIKQQITDNDLNEYFFFTGTLTPQQMKYARKNSDIYLSCGTHGNMTNTTIEALSDGLCTIIPLPNKNIGTDIDTNNFISANAAIRYGEQDDYESLAKILIELSQSPEQRNSIGNNGKTFAQNNIPSWEERITNELSIWENTCAE